MFNSKSIIPVVLGAAVTLLYGCSSTSDLPQAKTRASKTSNVDNYQYLIGPGDALNIFVWRNPEISGQYTVRPDGKVTTSLVEDIEVAGRTPSTLARQIEEKLSTFINNPRVTVSVNNFQGPLAEQVRVIGEAANPQAISYKQNLTLLDLMIAVGGLTEFADGNGAKLVRVKNGEQHTYNINIDDLIRDGDISKNVDILPGDIIIIPEAWF
ncbi:XrtA/PEP-CTERM system exopolysaccharide export protein [Alteromonas lipotrueiana]|uniref:XrtA/PEP-CTERM system exopolysaccharide export protein n=1 Tax=Alteromonas lipotrueiana TaxID=2803815 RepID=UPI001C44464B|nr:XrtA/PEP-CTERM system exopolysaccharide export protein [Alteromonas lipotrueiana]